MFVIYRFTVHKNEQDFKYLRTVNHNCTERRNQDQIKVTMLSTIPVQDRLSSSLLVRNADIKIYKTVTLHRLEDNMKMDLNGTEEFMNGIHVTWNIEQCYAF